jgi:hypothetical protein
MATTTGHNGHGVFNCRTFALAGRNREKLEQLKKALVDDGAQEADVGVIVADSNDG